MALSEVNPARVARLEERMDMVERKLTRFADAVEKNNEMTEALYDLVKSVKRGFKVLGWIGEAVRWLAPLVALAVAIYMWAKGGKFEFPKL